MIVKNKKKTNYLSSSFRTRIDKALAPCIPLHKNTHIVHIQTYLSFALCPQPHVSPSRKTIIYKIIKVFNCALKLYDFVFDNDFMYSFFSRTTRAHANIIFHVMKFESVAMFSFSTNNFFLFVISST